MVWGQIHNRQGASAFWVAGMGLMFSGAAKGGKAERKGTSGSASTAVEVSKKSRWPKETVAEPKVLNMSQGFSRIAAPGEKLSSQNHITCYNVMVVNLEKGTSYMAHVWEGGYGGMSNQQYNMLTEFTRPLGRQVGLVVEGSVSSPSHHVQSQLRKLGIEVLPLITVNSRNKRWGVDYDPARRHVTVKDEDGKELYQGKPFPPFEEVPAAEKGLSDSERMYRALQCIEDPRTKEFTEEGKQLLGKLLDNSELSSKLLYQLLEARAVAAGYEDYHDYFEADRKHFIQVAPDSLELMLRSIEGHTRFFRRYLNQKGARKHVPVTREKVMALLKEYPKELKQLIREAQALTQLKLGQSVISQPRKPLEKAP